MSLSKFTDAKGKNTVPPANNTPTDRVLSPSLNNQLHQLQISTPPRNGAFQFVAGANDAQLSTCELVNAQHRYLCPQPEGSANVEYPPGSSHDQLPQRKQGKRRPRTLLAMINEENNSNEITSSNNKYVDLLEKSIKRQKKDLDDAKDLINRETKMLNMLGNALVTCQICNDWNHTAIECPQRCVYPINPCANTVTDSSPLPCYLGTAAANHINQDLNGLGNSESYNGDVDLLIRKGPAS